MISILALALATSEPTAAPPEPSPAAQAAPASPAPESSATPSPYAYRFVPHVPPSPDPNEPVIYAVYLNSDTLRSRGPIMIRVETSASVVKVETKSNGHEGTVPNVSPGVFAASDTLPKIPFLGKGMTIRMNFIGTSADGHTVTVTVPVKLD